MKQNRFSCLGLVGGLGVGATIHYYKTLAKEHEAEGRALDIVIANAQTSRVFDYVQSGDREGLAEYLNSFIHRLKAAGADVAGAADASGQPLIVVLVDVRDPGNAGTVLRTADALSLIHI